MITSKFQRTLAAEGDPQPCIQTSDGSSLFLEFKTEDEEVFGFPYSQLVTYVLEPNHDRMTLTFSSHHVTISGLRLNALLPHLRAARIGTLTVGDPRYTNLHPTKPFISCISIQSIT